MSLGRLVAGDVARHARQINAQRGLEHVAHQAAAVEPFGGLAAPDVGGAEQGHGALQDYLHAAVGHRVLRGVGGTLRDVVIGEQAAEVAGEHRRTVHQRNGVVGGQVWQQGGQGGSGGRVGTATGGGFLGGDGAVWRGRLRSGWGAVGGLRQSGQCGNPECGCAKQAERFPERKRCGARVDLFVVRHAGITVLLSIRDDALVKGSVRSKRVNFPFYYL